MGLVNDLNTDHSTFVDFLANKHAQKLQKSTLGHPEKFKNQLLRFKINDYFDFFKNVSKTGATFNLFNQTIMTDLEYKPDYTILDIFGGAVFVILLGFLFIYLRISTLFRRNPSEVLQTE